MDKSGKEQWKGNDAMIHAVRIFCGTTHWFNNNPPTHRNTEMIVKEKLIIL